MTSRDDSGLRVRLKAAAHLAAMWPVASLLYDVERIRASAEVDSLPVEETPVLPLLYRRFHLLVKPWVRKHPTSSQKLWFWKDVLIAPR